MNLKKGEKDGLSSTYKRFSSSVCDTQVTVLSSDCDKEEVTCKGLLSLLPKCHFNDWKVNETSQVK